MRYEVKNYEAYIKAIPKERVEPIKTLRKTILNHLPEGFVEDFQYDMIAFVVPLKLYPAGYHVTKGMPLPFISIASQKHTINLYHSGIYGNKQVHDWFVSTYQKICHHKPNMGKSCIRFKDINQDVLTVVGELAEKMTVKAVIDMYESRKKGNA